MSTQSQGLTFASVFGGMDGGLVLNGYRVGSLLPLEKRETKRPKKKLLDIGSDSEEEVEVSPISPLLISYAAQLIPPLLNCQAKKEDDSDASEEAEEPDFDEADEELEGDYGNNWFDGGDADDDDVVGGGGDDGEGGGGGDD